jgi:hypothetical protein
MSFVRNSRVLSVPVGLHVGGETDHTVLLEATAEGILFVVSLALILPEAQGRIQLIQFVLPSAKKRRVS